MFTDLSDIDETAQAKVGAEIWTVKSDKAPHSKGMMPERPKSLANAGLFRYGIAP